MWITILITALAICVIGFWIGSTHSNKQLLADLVSLKPWSAEFQESLSGFEKLEASQWYVSDRDYQLWKAGYRHLADKCKPAFAGLNTTDPLKALILEFADRYFDGRRRIDAHNERFVLQEVPMIEQVLDGKGIRHNRDQVNAIASDENNTLLVAGAGTGKTTTILGKLAYLTERMGVKPEQILLLSFTGRAVDELSERIAKSLPGKRIEALTFHRFGLAIIGKVLTKKPELAFDSSGNRQKWLDEQFEGLIKNRDFLHLAIEYFAYFFKPVVLEPGFQSLDEYYQYAKSEANITLQKELLKSQQEVMIANFLYMNGVKYKYERPYPFETADKDFKQYRPDFYLPEFEIYIEHFGVDRNGLTRFTENEYQNAVQTRKYQQGMAWKRALHKQYRTTLIETFSYEFTERIWKTNLSQQLTARGVKFTPRNLDDVVKLVKESGSVKQITRLMGTFLDLAKSNGFDLEKLRSAVLARDVDREQAFFEIFAPIYRAYEVYLSQRGMIDFHDMLIKAAQFIRAGQDKAAYRYIIIDEFQDFSVSKYALVKALCEQNPDTKLFCVGDDWQSIFRFAGSDISLMTNFEDSYGFTRKNQLVVTNRFANGLAVISNQFILKNPNQIKKEVRSGHFDAGEAVEIRYRKNRTGIDELLHEILGTLNQTVAGRNERTSVFFLGRYRHNKPENLAAYSRRFGNLDIEYLTIHASKGSEADHVIILDLISGKHGFPSEITDDPLLEIVLSRGDSYPHAEERRLMYVAMTRARRKVFIITEHGQQSAFVIELEGFKRAGEKVKVCHECGGEMVERKGPYGTFLGCKNFPECTHKVKTERRRKSHRESRTQYRTLKNVGLTAPGGHQDSESGR